MVDKKRIKMAPQIKILAKNGFDSKTKVAKKKFKKLKKQVKTGNRKRKKEGASCSSPQGKE